MCRAKRITTASNWSKKPVTHWLWKCTPLIPNRFACWTRRISHRRPFYISRQVTMAALNRTMPHLTWTAIRFNPSQTNCRIITIDWITITTVLYFIQVKRSVSGQAKQLLICFLLNSTLSFLHSLNDLIVLIVCFFMFLFLNSSPITWTKSKHITFLHKSKRKN